MQTPLSSLRSSSAFQPSGVSLSAFPKSGVTYLSFLLFHCLFAGGDPHEIERRYVIDIHAFPEALHADPEGPRLFKSHYPYKVAMESGWAPERAIYLMRDPIDVMMSAWDFGHLINGSERDPSSPEFRAFVHRWIDTGGTAFPEYGSWVDHVRSWLDQSETPTHLVTYRDLVDSPDRELEGILRFLNIDVPAERQRHAIERSSMKAMAAFEEVEIEKKISGPFFSASLAAGLQLGHRFVNKGYRSSYDTILTPEERLIADRTFKSTMDLYAGRRP